MRWARLERAEFMASCLQSAAIYVAISLRDCVRYFANLARRAAHELYLWNAARTLQQFDDRILADIVCAGPRSKTPCAMAGSRG